MNLDHVLQDSALELDRKISAATTKRSGNEFHDLGIARTLLRDIARLKFDTPTPIQKGAIPAGINGDDVIAIAQTGSGKTLAFGIPMVQRLSKIKHGTGLVLVPTRELAIQVEESIRSIGRSMHMHSAVIIGGASMPLQRMALKKNPRIIIATPGRLMDHIQRRTVDLSRIEIFVLDEADRMLDMGFIPDIKKIMKSIPDTRQTMLFSATMPKEIEAIAGEITNEPIRLEIDRSGATPAEVSQELFMVTNQEKSRLLALRLKDCTGPVLVFTRTKYMASKLTTRVNKMGFSAAEIHSNRSQGQRRKALEGFKRGRYQILIATDIAARGIDVTGIELVVNYDMPANSEDYVHRIGRTGRAGKTGHAISFATTAQKRSIRDLERFMKIKVAISRVPALPSERSLMREGEQVWEQRDKSTGHKSYERPETRNESRRPYTMRTESTREESSERPSRRPGSKRPISKVHSPHKTESKNEKPFWTRFKKKKSSKKGSAGQGGHRKKRPRVK